MFFYVFLFQKVSNGHFFLRKVETKMKKALHRWKAFLYIILYDLTAMKFYAFHKHCFRYQSEECRGQQADGR